jgi:hypothetical protein
MSRNPRTDLKARSLLLLESETGFDRPQHVTIILQLHCDRTDRREEGELRLLLLDGGAPDYHLILPARRSSLQQTAVTSH